MARNFRAIWRNRPRGPRFQFLLGLLLPLLVTGPVDRVRGFHSRIRAAWRALLSGVHLGICKPCQATVHLIQAID